MFVQLLYIVYKFVLSQSTRLSRVLCYGVSQIWVVFLEQTNHSNNNQSQLNPNLQSFNLSQFNVHQPISLRDFIYIDSSYELLCINTYKEIALVLFLFLLHFVHSFILYEQHVFNPLQLAFKYVSIQSVCDFVTSFLLISNFKLRHNYGN